ncbi:putative transcription factor interactor and regulator CCHC(Zn) family [Helianthus annuus]|nr:putative transcription factor interactor and regulator CCHC(Zn) family [Helianthus annuus]
MYVEYEWSPHRCASCCVFGHTIDACPNQPMKLNKAMHEEHNQNVQKDRPARKMPVVDKDGYIGVYGKKAAKKVGILVNKQKSKFEYRPVGPKPKGDSNKALSSNSNRSNNPFDILNVVDADSGASIKTSGMNIEDTDEEVYNETDGFMMEGTLKIKSKGSSTPSSIVNDG